jgi:hypothetical protein
VHHYQAIECDYDNGSQIHNVGTVNKILTWLFESLGGIAPIRQ